MAGVRDEAVVASIPPWGLFRVFRAFQEKPGDIQIDLTLKEDEHAVSPAPIVSIGLHRGRPRCVVTEFSPISFTTHLAKSRALPETALQHYQAIARSSGRSLCRVLSIERALPVAEIARHTEAHARAVIEALLPRPIPAWSSRLQDPCGNGCVAAGFDPLPILMKAVADHPDTETMRAIVSRFLGQGDFHLASNHEKFLTAARSRFHDARVLFLLRQWRVHEVAMAVNSSERDLRVLFALIVAGVLERGDRRSKAASQGDASEDPVSKELRLISLDLRSRNHYEALDLTLECRLSEVQDAGRRLRKRFSRARYEGTTTPSGIQYLEEIHARIDEAITALSDPDLRSAYNRTLGTLTAETEARLATIFEAQRAYKAGMVALNTNDLKAATTWFERAMEQDPEEPLYPVALAQVLMTMPVSSGGTGRARDLLQSVLSRRPDFPEAHMVMATILRRQDRRAEALEHLRTVLQLDPEHAEARRLKELLSATSKPMPLDFRRKPESVFSRLKRKLTGE